ncbi:glutamate dehydrogenase, mitochondrial-like, partial [Asbolus verrucosus]
MAFKLNPKFSRFFSTAYEIPERYRNSFYLANAAFFDHANWFLHRAYEVCFPKLVPELRDKDPRLTEMEAIKNVMNVIQLLDQCNSIIDVRFPIQRENGKKEIIRGFRAQHGLYSGFDTCLGGLRLKENITRDHMKALSCIATYKHSCMGIRLAGAQGGIKIDPKKYSAVELQRIVKKYAAELYSKGFCDGLTDVIEPDINTGHQEMAWIASIFPDNYGSNPSFLQQGLGRLGGALAKYLENSGAIC